MNFLKFLRAFAPIIPVVFCTTLIAQATLETIRIVPPSSPLLAGGAQQTLIAIGTFSDQKEANLLSGVTWKVDDPTVLTVDPKSGLVTPKKAGTTSLRVWNAETSTGGGLRLTVAAAPKLAVGSFSVIATTTTIAKGDTVQLSALARFDPADSVGPSQAQIVTEDLKWSSSDSNAKVDPETGLVTGLAVGSVTIMATSKDPAFAARPSATLDLTVTEPPTISAATQPGTATDVTASTAKPGTTTVPQLQKLVGGSKTLSVVAKTGDTLTIYKFDPGDHPLSTCSTADITNGSSLSIVTSANGTGTSIPAPSGSPPYNLALTQPLVAGTGICVSETATDDNTKTAWSAFQIVSDPNDYGRVRTYFIAGVQVSNQQSASASSTAGQYLEAGFNYTYMRPGDKWDFRYPCDPYTPRDASVKAHPCATPHKRTFGLSSNLDIRLSPIPVAAPATTTTAATTTTTASSTTTQNLLSSQQSARVVSSFYAPYKLTHWNNHTDYFTLAPLARAGFATLLNPSVGSNTSSGSSAQLATTTTATFNSSYYFNGFGARLAWDRFPASTDKAAQPIAQFFFTFGRYSNLPSYVCKSFSNPPTPPPDSTIVTACSLLPSTKNPAGIVTSGYLSSRTLLPRIDIEGIAKLPNYPFVLGLDANLAQYTFPRRANLDYLNKAGNDIRIYVGFTLDLNSVIGKLGVTSQ